ncbi:hypothetical protein BHYA_0023g00210 [Botrytis hyacinthi]|uniref:Uncharacterized protein n=1 Tax=Botrytis hyacinthi TaxID=278943 RepID=A0A4Z1H125_9HELO|nr:hypothetical protein BHYA_0023g00210 [Botrytis hyacinthi]
MRTPFAKRVPITSLTFALNSIGVNCNPSMPTETTCVGTALDVVLDCAVTLSPPRTSSANHAIKNLNIFHTIISDAMLCIPKEISNQDTNEYGNRKRKRNPGSRNGKHDELVLSGQPAKTSWLFAVSFLPINIQTFREKFLVRHR